MQPFTPKIIFFDIDDTLSRDGVIAAHNQKTLEQLAQSRQHSHSHGDLKLVIATGRAKPFLPDDIVALHQQGIIDAIICKNGQYAYQDVQHTPNLTNNQTDNQTNNQTNNKPTTTQRTKQTAKQLAKRTPIKRLSVITHSLPNKLSKLSAYASKQTSSINLSPPPILVGQVTHLSMKKSAN